MISNSYQELLLPLRHREHEKEHKWIKPRETNEVMIKLGFSWDWNTLIGGRDLKAAFFSVQVPERLVAAISQFPLSPRSQAALPICSQHFLKESPLLFQCRSKEWISSSSMATQKVPLALHCYLTNHGISALSGSLWQTQIIELTACQAYCILKWAPQYLRHPWPCMYKAGNPIWCEKQRTRKPSFETCSQKTLMPKESWKGRT